MKILKPILLICVLPVFLAGSFTRADLIADWNKTASDYLIQNAPNHYDRGMTMVHVAQFDVVNAVSGGYVPYLLNVSAPGASPEAAAAQAAYTILTNISRANISTLNDALQKSLANIPPGPGKDDGLQLGRQAAAEFIQLRGAENADLAITPPTSTVVGKWRITPPNSPPGVFANARYRLPWTMRSMSQFRPGPPPALSSERYATDFEEVRSLGAQTGSPRTPDQAEAANFHGGDDLAYLRPALARSTLPLIESARAVALYYMAWADARNAFFEAQYVYSAWRPYSAIRLADTDGNDRTTADPAWTPFLGTPNHPEYPSGTCATTAAIVEVLTSFYGDDYSFTGTIEGPHSRQFARLSAAIDDAVIARIAAGAHFRFSCLTGLELGRKIARNALANFLRPAPRLVSGARLNTGEFQLSLATGRPPSFVVETSSDLVQWHPWQTNVYGILWLKDPSVDAAQHQFYRAVEE